MKRECPRCHAKKENVRYSGYYRRKSDSKKIRRLECTVCEKRFSHATFSPCCHQNKRRHNIIVKNALCSLMSMRRIAKVNKLSRTTVKRKLEFLASQARLSQKKWLESLDYKFTQVQFDDLETIEHTKCKPLSVTLFVEKETRKIIDFEVFKIPAKGPLAKVSRRKYGKRENESFKKRADLFNRIKDFVDKEAVIDSDESVFYVKPVREFFPHAIHRRHKGKRGCVTGQGELKKIGRDPLFSINHTFAMLRANINRLIRKSWCTTKKVSALEDHIAMYVDFHNSELT